jgi:SAM-dependent methyltransferase
MKNNLDQALFKAVMSIKKNFPIRDYVSDYTYYALQPIVKQLFQCLKIDCQTYELKNLGSLLDIGSGPMSKTAIFRRIGFECYAVDDLQDNWHRRDDNLDLILKFADSEGIHFHLQNVDGNEIPFAANSFDVVTCFNVLEHMHHSPRELLNTIGAFTKPEGLIVLSVPNSVNLRKRLAVLFGRTNYPSIDQVFLCDKWRGHVHEYTLAELICVAKKWTSRFLVQKH